MPPHFLKKKFFFYILSKQKFKHTWQKKIIFFRYSLKNEISKRIFYIHQKQRFLKYFYLYQHRNLLKMVLHITLEKMWCSLKASVSFNLWSFAIFPYFRAIFPIFD